MHDEVLVVALVATFAALVTAHVSLVAALAPRRPVWQTFAALVVVPLAPYWGSRERLHARVVAWVAAALAYVVLLVVSLR